MQALSARLRQRFSPALRLRRADGLATLRPGGQGDWILARGLCAYTVIDASTVPAARRKVFVQGMARRWAPFGDPAFYVAWAGDRAMVWGWSSSAVLAPVASGERAPRRVFPESLLRGDVRDAGVELIALDAGYEGRAWSAGVLQASTWWPESPSLADWNVFVRGAGLPAMAALPVAIEEDFRDAPWSAASATRADFSRHRALVVPALLAAALAAVAFPLGSSLRLLAETAGLERAIATQEGLVAEILAARESAEADAVEIDALLALRPRTGQIRMLSALTRAIPGTGWQVLEWRVPEPARLEAVLRASDPDPRAMVRGLEASGVFASVSVETGSRPDEVVIKAQLAEPATAEQP
jgi:hypothetical protein